MLQLDLARYEREELRWRILRLLEFNMPRPSRDFSLMLAVNDVGMVTDLEQLRTELLYLREKNLIRVEQTSIGWRASLTGHGMDVVQGAVDPPIGVRRID